MSPMATTGARRVGRPSKGDRDHLVTRPARPIAEAVRAAASELGYDSVSDYVAAVLAERHGLDHLAPLPSHSGQREVLDIPA
jgi:hypothetical protein